MREYKSELVAEKHASPKVGERLTYLAKLGYKLTSVTFLKTVEKIHSTEEQLFLLIVEKEVE